MVFKSGVDAGSSTRLKELRPKSLRLGIATRFVCGWFHRRELASMPRTAARFVWVYSSTRSACKLAVTTSCVCCVGSVALFVCICSSRRQGCIADGRFKAQHVISEAATASQQGTATDALQLRSLRSLRFQRRLSCVVGLQRAAGWCSTVALRQF